MKSSSIIFMLLFGLGFTACQAVRSGSSLSITATSKQEMTVSSQTSQIQTNTTSSENLSVTPVDVMEPIRISTIAEAEKLAGFNVQEPAYLPEGVSFDFATYQEMPNPSVTLYFKIIHAQFGDMGVFFQILQELQEKAPPDVTSCDLSTDGICEILQFGAIPVVYHHYSGGTEGLDWYYDGFAYRLLRTAGEPGKVYKDELVKVVDSMK